MKLSQGQKSGNALLYSLWLYSSLPSLCCLMSGAPNPFTCQSMCVLFRCLNDWMFCVSCWKIKMAKTLSAGSAKPESGPHFRQESGTAGEPLLKKKLLLKKRSLQLLSFKAKKRIVGFFLENSLQSWLLCLANDKVLFVIL